MLLGFYRQAFQLMALPVALLQFPVQYVAEPTLSAVQNDDRTYRHYFKKIVGLVAFISMPLAVYLFIYSKPLILLLFGEKWVASAPIFKALAAAAFIQPLASAGGIVMVTRGKTGCYLRLGIITAVSLVGSFGIGIFWGPTGVAIAYTIATYLIFIPSLWYSFQETPITLSMFLREISQAALASSLMGGILLALSWQLSGMRSPLIIAISLAAASLSYLGIWFLLPNGRKKVSQIISYPLEVYRAKVSGARS
jgi:O-antigen/teichoic acid export membrane protein